MPNNVKSPEISVLLPCLNEAATLGGCLKELRDCFAKWDPRSYELVVADNGSDDGSRDVALEWGARVVQVPARGYGNALRQGLESAHGEWILIVDADGTYPLSLAAVLVRSTIESNAAIGLASRLAGNIQPNAMPWLHRRIGTPFFTLLLNRLYGGEVTDCGTGFRCIRKKWFLDHPHHSEGMEFASENLIRAWKSGAKIVEISAGLRKAPVERIPHLRTWRDGMRHLLFILAERPAIFEGVGLAGCMSGAFLQAAAAVHGPLRIGVVDIFGLHTQGLALLGGLLTAQIYVLALFLYDRAPEKPSSLTRLLLGLREDQLLFGLFSAIIVGIGVIIAVFVIWWRSHFSGMSEERGLIAGIHVAGLLGMISLGLLGLHMGRTRPR